MSDDKRRISFPSTDLLSLDRGVGAALRDRTSASRFGGGAIPREAVATILTQSAGVTPEHGRGTPSPARVYPLWLGVLMVDVDSLPAGAYSYDAQDNGLDAIAFDSEPRAWLEAALKSNPGLAETAAMHVFILGSEDELRRRFGAHSQRLLHLEAGHLAQSMILVATELDLASCPVGNFDALAVQSAFGNQEPGLSAVHSVSFGRRPV